MAKKITIEELIDIAKSRGGECLSKSYIDSRTKLLWQCIQGHTWKAIPASVKLRTWCPHCARNVKLSIKDAINLASEKGGKCLSKNYKNTKTRLKWQCAQNHIFEANYESIYRGRWCPHCNLRISERICRIYFETIFKRKFKTVQFDWLLNASGNRMHLDGYNDRLKLGFEYQGVQHYKFNKKYHKTENDLKRRIYDDNLKKKLCKQNDIKLIIVPYTVPIKNMCEFIIKELHLIGIKNVKLPNKDDISLAYNDNNLSELKEIAKKKNGECISKLYRGIDEHLKWKCEFGHIWEATPYSIKSLKTWCPNCAGNLPLNITKDEIIEKLIGLSEKIQKSPSRDDWQNHNMQPSSRYIKKIFGTWNKAIKESGLIENPFGKGRNIYNTNDELLLELERFAQKIGKVPMAIDLDKDKDFPGKNTYIKRFGSWKKALMAAGLIKSITKFTIEDMQNIARSNKGECLSAKYKGVKTKLKWQCEKGHTWEAVPYSIKDLGTWCPICYKLNRK